MVRLFYTNKNGTLTWEKNPDSLLPEQSERIVWVDMQSPTQREKRQIESQFKIELFTPRKRQR